MAQDIRRIVFSTDEVIAAIEAFRNVTPHFLPDGRIAAAVPADDHALILSLETAKDGVIVKTPVRLSSMDILKALIRFCIVNNIVLPRAGQKSFSITPECAALNIKLDIPVDIGATKATPAAPQPPAKPQASKATAVGA